MSSTATMSPPTTIGFGKRVIVRAETVRVIGKRINGEPTFRQSAAARDNGRLVKHDFEGPWSAVDGWPGHAVSLNVAPSNSPAFHPGPDLEDDVLTRLRRIPLDTPEIGIVIGVTRRLEGTQRGDNEDAHLAGPGRTVRLFEVALQPTGSSKARITLAHAIDLELVERSRG